MPEVPPLPPPPNPVGELREDYRRLADEILSEAARAAPRRDGHLAASGRVRRIRARKGNAGHSRFVVEFTVPYARAAEKSKPYLNPAAAAVLARWRGSNRAQAAAQAALSRYGHRTIRVTLGG